MEQVKVAKKKLIMLWATLIGVFIIFLFIILMPKNYIKNYEKDEVKIVEKYDKKEKNYYFTLTYNDITLDYLINSKYKQTQGLIEKVKIVKDKEENFCLIPKGNDLNWIPLCYDKKESVYYELVNDELKKGLNYKKKENKLLDNYKDIEIYNKDYTYLLWNYDGFYYITKDIKKKIDIFDKEMYNISLIGYTKDYLVVADYDSNYTFNKIYTIDFNKGNLKKHEIDRTIYFDSYFIGYVKNKIYIVDNKESTMYELNAKNGEIDKIKSKVLKDNNWENVNIKTLVNQKQEFEYSTNYQYELEKGNLFLTYKDKETKKKVATDVTSVIRINDYDIFYLKKDTLYHFNETTGNEKLLTNFEWNFNSNNMIYIN